MTKSMGIALVISVIIVSIVLAVGIGVSNIVSTEISLSNTGRQSQFAFYAADVGVDCAIYWDTAHQGLSQSAFATSTPSGQNTLANACAGDTLTVGGTASCVNSLDGSGISSACGSGDKKAGVSTFILTFDNGSCSKVTVIKRQDQLVAPTAIETFIHADGFSAACNSTSPRVFQRSLETTVFE